MCPGSMTMTLCSVRSLTLEKVLQACPATFPNLCVHSQCSVSSDPNLSLQFSSLWLCTLLCILHIIPCQMPVVLKASVILRTLESQEAPLGSLVQLFFLCWWVKLPLRAPILKYLNTSKILLGPQILTLQCLLTEFYAGLYSL